ncbi:aldehyde dehydrogenase family protein [soil metagenome]
MSTIAELFETMEYGPAPESGTPAREWIADRGGEGRLFIGGEWRAPESGEFFETTNPATGEALARIAQAGAADVEAAVGAARDALPAWRELGGHARARYLYAIARQIQKQSRLFSTLETLDNGKPIRESRDLDIPLVARHFYHHAGWAQLLESEFPGTRGVGVVGQIIPWNFPLLMLAWKVAPALATGCTVVLKPAEFTSLTAMLFAEVCERIGLPPGVFNVVTGNGSTGELLVRHPDIDKIAFTGSTEVGRQIRVATAGSGKRLSLELGGKSPFVVFEDADLDGVVEGVVDAIWFNQGQVCCAGSRILAQEGIAPRLVEKLRERMERLRVGDPMDKATDIGAIVAPVQLERIEALVAQGEEEGATRWQPSWSCPEEGCFYPPTLFTEVAPSSVIAQEEIFGPVVVMMTFRTPDEGVELANNTRYGLAASIWSENINLALDVAPKIKAGTVWINSTNLFDAASGFGGYRESGFGREGGREGLWEYLESAEPAVRNTEYAVRGTQYAAGPGTASLSASTLPPIDRTAKLYIGAKQVRPDGGYSLPVAGFDGAVIGEVGRGNRKDVRNAVEAANRAGVAWARTPAHTRAQVLFYLAENLAARSEEFARRLEQGSGDPAEAAREVELSVRRIYTYAAWADKWDGAVHATPIRNVTLAMHEPVGTIGVACPDEAPLLGLLSTILPPIALGNTVVVIPSENFPLAATDLYQVFETSDLPAGVVNLVTGARDELGAVLAAHDDVEAVWYWGSVAGAAEVERLSAGNMKRTWTDGGRGRDWMDPEQGEGKEFLREATQVKNIWVPFGE